MTGIDELVCATLADGEAFGFAPDAALQATPILNWGGFVNRSFVVIGGDRRVHVKLSSDADTVRGLRRWWQLGDHLAQRYGAPRMLGWLSLPGSSLEGAVLEWIDGVVPTSRDDALTRAAGALLAALHDDTQLAERLRDEGAPIRSCAAAYRDSLHDRFVEDLRGISGALPPFVTPTLVRWMAGEADALLTRIDADPAFRTPADTATHQDPWLNNLLLATSGRVHLLDWDDLSLGDRMMDWAMLLGPTMDDVRPADAAALPDGDFDHAALARFAMLSRASLLDWVIDSLADWVEAEGTEHVDAVRGEKQRVHEAALASYRERYG